MKTIKVTIVAKEINAVLSVKSVKISKISEIERVKQSAIDNFTPLTNQCKELVSKYGVYATVN